MVTPELAAMLDRFKPAAALAPRPLPLVSDGAALEDFRTEATDGV